MGSGQRGKGREMGQRRTTDCRVEEGQQGYRGSNDALTFQCRPLFWYSCRLLDTPYPLETILPIVTHTPRTISRTHELTNSIAPLTARLGDPRLTHPISARWKLQGRSKARLIRASRNSLVDPRSSNVGQFTNILQLFPSSTCDSFPSIPPPRAQPIRGYGANSRPAPHAPGSSPTFALTTHS